MQRLLALIRPLLDFDDFLRDDSDLIWLRASVPISAFAFPNFQRQDTMDKWIETEELKVKGIIGSRQQLPLHVIPQTVMNSFVDPLNAPAMVPWDANPVNMGWKRFWSVSTPIFKFIDPWDKLAGENGEVYLQRCC